MYIGKNIFRVDSRRFARKDGTRVFSLFHSVFPLHIFLFSLDARQRAKEQRARGADRAESFANAKRCLVVRKIACAGSMNRVTVKRSVDAAGYHARLTERSYDVDPVVSGSRGRVPSFPYLSAN